MIPDALFGERPIQAFDEGTAAFLVRNREANLGHLLLAERATFYVQILYRMLLFRNDHELEPLYEDLQEAVGEAQGLLQDSPYTPTQFRGDLTQLEEWQLVTSRIERQRIRGYRDNRKRKYRYKLTDESLAFLRWLEDRLQDDMEGRSVDARNQLEDVSGALKELLRLLRSPQARQPGEEEARRVLYQVFKLVDITTGINTNLGSFHAQLLGFISHPYAVDETRQILLELDNYLAQFLRRIRVLRQEILSNLEALNTPYLRERLRLAFDVMVSERKKAPHLIRRGGEHPEQSHARLQHFYREGGYLDRLATRIDASALLVLRKLYSHLRELERKSHRLEDLDARLRELTCLEELDVPHEFLNRLISTGHAHFDMNAWSETEKAEPPKPRAASSKQKRIIPSCLRKRTPGAQPPRSIEQVRLELLRSWIERKVLANGAQRGTVSRAQLSTFADFGFMMALARNGYLGSGKKLDRIGFQLATGQERVETQIDDQLLAYNEMEVEKKS